MLAPFIIGLMQDTVNRFLQLDPELFERLEQLEKKVIAVELSGFPGVLYIQPSVTGLLFYHQYEGTVDTVLSGSLFSLIDMGLKKGSKINKKLFSNDISISGDLEFGQAFKEVLDSLEIDWEYYLSFAVGDIVAHQIGKTIKHFLEWGRQSTVTLIENTKEYFQEESRHIPPQEEFEDFREDISELAMAVDRLEARLQRFSQQAELSENF